MAITQWTYLGYHQWGGVWISLLPEFLHFHSYCLKCVSIFDRNCPNPTGCAAVPNPPPVNTPMNYSVKLKCLKCKAYHVLFEWRLWLESCVVMINVYLPLRLCWNYHLDISTLLSVYIRSTTATVRDCSPAFYWWTLFWSHDHCCCCYAEVVVVTVGEELGQFRNPGPGSGLVWLCGFLVLLWSFWRECDCPEQEHGCFLDSHYCLRWWYVPGLLIVYPWLSDLWSECQGSVQFHLWRMLHNHRNWYCIQPHTCHFYLWGEQVVDGWYWTACGKC